MTICLHSSLNADDLNIAILNIQNGEYEKAKILLEGIVKENPNSAIAYNYLGYSNLLLGKYKDSLASYKKSDSINPSLDSKAGIQWSLLFLEKHEESISAGKKALEFSPFNYLIHIRIAFSYYSLEQYEKALEHYNISDTSYSTLDSRGGIQLSLLALQKYEQSITAGNRALEFSPNNYTFQIRIAYAYLSLKKYDKAKELYNNLVLLYGSNADLQHGLGLCEYHQGNEDNAISNFEIGYKQNPAHPGIRYSLGLNPITPLNFELTPFYAGYQFHNSSSIGNGHKQGANLSIGVTDSWKVSFGGYHDTALNLASSKGYENYIFDKYNLLQFSFYTSPTQYQTFFQSPYVMYSLYNIGNAKDFLMSNYSSSITYRYSSNFSYKFSYNYLYSNSSYINSGKSFQTSIIYGIKNPLTVSIASISLPKNSGGQFFIGYSWNLYGNFRSETSLISQAMTLTSTQTDLISINPVYTYSHNTSKMHTYASMSQGFSYSWSWLTIGAGGRYGSNYNPVVGDYLIYTPSKLNSGGYAFISIHYFSNATFNINYSRDYWKNTLNESVNSDQIKFSLTVRW